MNNKVGLLKAKNNIFTSEIYRMMVEELGIKDVFRRKTDRLTQAKYKYLIRYKDTIVGFVNLIKENCNDDFLFLDMGIKARYKGQGIGSAVLNKIKEMNIDEYIIAETSVDNILANEAIRNIGFGLAAVNRNNYYLLQDYRLKEFIDNGYLTKLREHLDSKYKNKVLVYR